MNQIRLALGSVPGTAGNLKCSPDPIDGGEGDRLPLHTELTISWSSENTFLHCTSKMHIRSFISGVRASGTLYFYSAALLL